MHFQTKTVGVVIATYNGKEYLEAQLNSIIAQTHLPTIIVVVDDSSQDGTKAIIRKYELQNPGLFMVIENSVNLGVKKTFEKGIEACMTDYIALSDQDDVWQHSKIEEMFNLLESKNDSLFSFHDLTFIDQLGNSFNKNFWETAPPSEPLPVIGFQAQKRLAKLSNPVPGCTMFFSSALKKHILPMPDSRWIGHDWWISVVAFFYGNPCYIEKPLGYYRVHSGQTAGIGTTIKKNFKAKSTITLRKKILREIKRIFKSKSIKKIKEEETKQRIHDMSTRLLIVLDECKRINGDHDDTVEYNTLKNMINVNLYRRGCA